MKVFLWLSIRICFIVCLLWFMTTTTAFATYVLSLDGTRTGDELESGGDRYLTSVAMQDATNILLNAGHIIGTTDRFISTNITGWDVLYTATVDTAFTGQELTDIQAFVSAGGGLVMQRDWDGFYAASDPLANVFGVSYNPGPFGIGGTPTAVDQIAAHPIWSGPAGTVTSYDQVFSSSIVSGAVSIGAHSTNPTQSGLGVLQHGLGRVVFLTDMNAWDSFGDPTTPLPGNNNAIVWENMFHWAQHGAQVPEPATMTLLGIGLVGLVGASARRRFKKKEAGKS